MKCIVSVNKIIKQKRQSEAVEVLGGEQSSESDTDSETESETQTEAKHHSLNDEEGHAMEQTAGDVKLLHNDNVDNIQKKLPVTPKKDTSKKRVHLDHTYVRSKQKIKKCDSCGYTSRFPGDIIRHMKQYCPAKKHIKKQDVLNFILKSNITIKDARKIFTFFAKRIGKQLFQKGSIKSISKARQNFSSLFISEKLQWAGKETIVTTVRSLEELASLLQTGRKVLKPFYSIGVDSGQNCLLATITQYETGPHQPHQEQETRKEGGTNRVLVIAAIDQVEESRQSAQFLLIEKLKVNQFESLGYIVCDLKFVGIVTGLCNGLPSYGCPYCLGKRQRVHYDRKDRSKFKIWWPAGELRSYVSNLEDHAKFCLGASVDDHHNVVTQPVELLPTAKLNTPYLYYIPPEPLHHFLGKIINILCLFTTFIFLFQD